MDTRRRRQDAHDAKYNHVKYVASISETEKSYIYENRPCKLTSAYPPIHLPFQVSCLYTEPRTLSSVCVFFWSLSFSLVCRATIPISTPSSSTSPNRRSSVRSVPPRNRFQTCRHLFARRVDRAAASSRSQPRRPWTASAACRWVRNASMAGLPFFEPVEPGHFQHRALCSRSGCVSNADATVRRLSPGPFAARASVSPHGNSDRAGATCETSFFFQKL